MFVSHLALPSVLQGRAIRLVLILTVLAGPILLGCDGHEKDAHASDWRDYESHKDEHQVDLDVNRSFIYYPKGWSIL